MGGDDLASDDEYLYASDHSSVSDELHGQKNDTDEKLDSTSQKRKAAETDTSVTSSKKKPKKSSEESAAAIFRQSASEQAVFLSQTIAKYVMSLEHQQLKGMEVKPGDIATSKKDTLLHRINDIVAQNKIRKWKHKLSPCVVVICVSARRAVQVLKELAPIKARAAKLFPKNGSISEQLKELADAPFGIAVGTPHRIHGLCRGEDSTALTLRHTQLVVFDSHLNDKQYSVLTLPDTAPSCVEFLVHSVAPELRQRKDIRMALL